MPLKRLIPAAILVAVLVVQFTVVPLAGAVVHDHVPVSFTLTPENCPDVETMITGEGEYFFRINERVMNDGSTHLIVNVTIAGWAFDTEGNRYRFNYHNTFHGVAPIGVTEFTMRSTDHFNLVGAGGANTVHVGFVSDVTFIELGQGPPIAEEFINVRGTLSCDQI